MDWEILTKLVQSLSWPILVAVVVFAYRKELRGLFKSGFEGFGVKVPPSQPGEIAASEPSGRIVEASGTLSGTASLSADGSVTRTTATESEGEWDKPVATDDPALNRRASEFQNVVPGPVSADQKRNMAVALARASLDLQFERIYRLIYGSQLQALLLMNQPTGASEKELRDLLEKYPDTASTTGFEPWLDFLVKVTGLAEEIPSDSPYAPPTKRYRTTNFGRSFMQYLVRWGLTGLKPF